MDGLKADSGLHITARLILEFRAHSDTEMTICLYTSLLPHSIDMQGRRKGVCGLYFLFFPTFQMSFFSEAIWGFSHPFVIVLFWFSFSFSSFSF